MVIRACDVYEIFGLPLGLRLHHANTVAVAKCLSASAPPELAAAGREAMMAMALHDVGNAVKFDDEPSLALRMLQEPPDTLDRWRLYASVQRARYGFDDHEATAAMLGELGVRPSIVELILTKSSKNLPAIVMRARPVELLALYADMRVAPEGIVAIEDRHYEAVERYRGTAREGLGGTISLEQLLDLEEMVGRLFGTDPRQLDAGEIASHIDDALGLELDDVLGNDA